MKNLSLKERAEKADYSELYRSKGINRETRRSDIKELLKSKNKIKTLKPKRKRRKLSDWLKSHIKKLMVSE